MCGVVLEASLRARFPDDALDAAGMRPRFRHAKAYSLGQRLQFEWGHPIFTTEHRLEARQLLNGRNDIVHVQPDTGPKAIAVIAGLAILLTVMFPPET